MSALAKLSAVGASTPAFAISYRHADGTPAPFHGRVDADSHWSALRKWRAEDAEWATQGWPAHTPIAVSLMGFDEESGNWLPIEWVPVEQLEAEADDDAAHADSLHDAGLVR